MEAEEVGARDRAARLREVRRRIGVLLADASGHSTTDAVLTAMLHQAFLTGVLYELELHGHVVRQHVDAFFAGVPALRLLVVAADREQRLIVERPRSSASEPTR